MTTFRISLWQKSRILVCVLVTLSFSLSAMAQKGPNFQGQGALKIMTYNMDVGTDYAGLLDPDLDKFKQAASNMVEAFRASDPVGRTQAIARQIADKKPHLVSLQEVAAVSTGTSKDSLTVEFDFQQLLLEALSAEGLQYVPVAWSQTWDATIPTLTGYARNTWSVVILARADLDPADFSFSNSLGGTWTATFVPHLYALDGHAEYCPVPLQSNKCRMPWRRGWAQTDVFYRDKRFRFIAAHLDSASYLLEIPQGVELLNGPANTSLPVIVAADLNCDCSNPADPTYPTCVNFSKAGFVDAWAEVNPGENGYTKYLPQMSQRSDYVMARGRFAVQAATIVGDQPADKTASGLWPSDHAGVVVRLQSPGNQQ